MKKNKYFEPILTIGLPLLICGMILIGIQNVLGQKSIKITDNIGDEYYYDGKYDNAIAEYEKMQQNDKWPIWTIKIAEVYAAKGDISKANNILKEAMVARDKLMKENDKDYLEQDKEFINRLVFNFYVNREFEEAESIGEYYLQTYNSYKPLLKSMFAVYLANSNKASAENIVDIYPVDSESSFDLAILAQMKLMLGKYQEGINNLAKAWKLDRNEIKILDVIMETAEYDKDNLKREIKKLSEQQPQEEAYKLWLNEIDSLRIENSIIDIIDKEIELGINKESLSKNSYVSYYIKAIDELKNKQYNKAMENCIKSIDSNNEYVNTYGVLMPEILIADGNSNKIESYFRTALYREPYNVNLILNIGKIYGESTSDYNKAKEYYDLGIALNKNESILYYELGKLNAKQEKYDEAITNIKKAISIDEEESSYYRALGKVYFENLNYDKAIDNTRMAYSLDNNDVLALNNAACYYILVEDNIWRAYENMKSAYENIPSDLDEKSKELIKNNYSEIKSVYDIFVNNENALIQKPNLELAY